MSVIKDTISDTDTIAIERNPINNNGNVTIGPNTFLIISRHFKNTNFSCAEIMLENTLIGNEIAKLMVNNIIKTLAIPYSLVVSPSENTIDK